jgi:hypothetical protein
MQSIKFILFNALDTSSFYTPLSEDLTLQYSLLTPEDLALIIPDSVIKHFKEVTPT